ncbi:MAG: 3-keto-5-aminohexanoate cleavage protein, partial [Desulfobacula sp.]|uniref:3-keto-5-aminohexanoate cleavage protein n=1 Tax=Desulfobacula sp. TaxID=2593537 RepID=UPI0025C1A7ED
QRIAPVLELKPEIASLNTASRNDGLTDHRTGEVLFEYVFENPLNMIADFAKMMKENRVKPALEVYDPAGIQNILLLHKRKLTFEDPLHFQFVYGAYCGVCFSPQMHLTMIGLLPEDATFGVCGIGDSQVPAVLMSMMTGGHVRIGLEDNVRVPGGALAKGSWEQAKWVCEAAKILDRPIATPEEAKQILGLV